ncbi:MAG: hypothetical protein JRG91_04265 [Deltaproteobacteria bacterium]|nr:hypothetical protein [Deltaproteobacteria bacterium]
MRRRLQVIIPTLAILVAASSCGFGPLDSLGVEAAVTEEGKNNLEPEDDRIEDKNPEYDPDRIVCETFGECSMCMNKSATVTKLDIAPLKDVDRDLVGRVFGSRSEAASHVQGRLDAKSSLLPSMEVVNGAMKPFNDGLYAAVEIGVQEGVESEGVEIYPSKRAFLHDLIAALLDLTAGATAAQTVHLEAAAVDVGAALVLAGETPDLPPDLLSAADSQVSEFLSAGLFSRPIGFYTWTPALEQIFRQDRYLQNYMVEASFPPDDPYSSFEVGRAAAVAVALQADPDLLERYEGYLALYAGLTNPFMNHSVSSLLPYVSGPGSLDDVGSITSAFLADNPHPALPIQPQCWPHFALFPSSTSKETAYFEAMFCTEDSAPDEDFNVMDELITAIKDGLIDLVPDGSSGWYDYQSFALETLLLPERGSESEHLLLTAAYKKKLMDTFRSIMTQNRETHVKQLEIGSMAGGVSMPPPEVDIYPYFPVEPFPTFYLRSARAYRFLSTYLEAVLGAGFLDEMHRMVEDGTTVEVSLREELRQKAMLLYGLHLLTADSVGMAPELLGEELAEYDEGECRGEAWGWITGWTSDADVLRDPRVIVPVQRDLMNGQVIYWAILGVKVIKARAEFVDGWGPRDISGWCELRDILPHSYYLVVEQFAEVRIREDVAPPTREEFRQICDAHESTEDIVAALEAL